jgi:multidrug efflux pump subunit AcrA (membrane-fusion protein)
MVDGNDAWPDEEITVNAGRGNDNYKCVVPSSAVSKDNNGAFVYVIVGSSTPLGDKYNVKRVDVTVEATDGSASAIKGEGLDKYDVMIVVRSEKPLEDGQRVRLEDYSAK